MEQKDTEQVKIPKKLTEEYKVGERVRRRFRTGVKDFELIVPGDHILVGLSGGKDSMALLELLGELRRQMRESIRLSALHVRMENVDYQSDSSYLANFAAQCGAEFVLRTANFEKDREEGRTPCFLCSWNRRKTLFETAKDLGCNKIALGHHQDDILRTAMMNLTFNGSFATMPALLQMRKMPLTIIRPLCKVEEEDLVKWSIFHQYEPLKKLCPHEKESNRTSIENVMNAMKTLNPEYRYHLWRALEKENKLVEK